MTDEKKIPIVPMPQANDYRLQGYLHRPGLPLNARRNQHRNPLEHNVGVNRPEEKKQELEIAAHGGEIKVRDGAEVKINRPVVVDRNYDVNSWDIDAYTAVHDSEGAIKQLAIMEKCIRKHNDVTIWNTKWETLLYYKPLIYLLYLICLMGELSVCLIEDVFVTKIWTGHFYRPILFLITYGLTYAFYNIDILSYGIDLFLAVFYYMDEFENYLIMKYYYIRYCKFLQYDVRYEVLDVQRRAVNEQEVRSARSYYTPCIIQGRHYTRMRRTVYRHGDFGNQVKEFWLPTGLVCELLDTYHFRSNGVVPNETLDFALKMLQDLYSYDFVELEENKDNITCFIQEYVYAKKINRIRAHLGTAQ